MSDEDFCTECGGEAVKAERTFLGPGKVRYEFEEPLSTTQRQRMQFESLLAEETTVTVHEEGCPLAEEVIEGA